MTAAAPAPVSLPHHFADLDDPRSEHTRLHGLLDIIALTLCAVVSGAEGWTEVEAYGREKRDWLETFLDLPNELGDAVRPEEDLLPLRVVQVEAHVTCAAVREYR